VQLAKRRGATVLAVQALRKRQALRPWERPSHCSGFRSVEGVRADQIDAIVDVVGGGRFRHCSRCYARRKLRRRRRDRRTIVDLDLRTLYLKDLRLLGCTVLEPEVFGNLVRYIERGEIRPLLAGVHPLAAIVQAQQEFLAKQRMGKVISFHEFSASQPLQCQLRDRHVLHSHAREVGDADVLRATAPERRVLNDTASSTRSLVSINPCSSANAESPYSNTDSRCRRRDLGERQEPGSNSCLPPPSAPTAVM